MAATAAAAAAATGRRKTHVVAHRTVEVLVGVHLHARVKRDTNGCRRAGQKKKNARGACAGCVRATLTRTMRYVSRRSASRRRRLRATNDMAVRSVCVCRGLWCADARFEKFLRIESVARRCDSEHKWRRAESASCRRTAAGGKISTSASICVCVCVCVCVRARVFRVRPDSDTKSRVDAAAASERVD